MTEAEVQAHGVPTRPSHGVVPSKLRASPNSVATITGGSGN